MLYDFITQVKEFVFSWSIFTWSSSQDDFANSIEAQMYNGLENYNETGYEGVTETWNYVQQELQCCGIVNSTDWTDVYVKTPASCCASNKPSCSQESTDLFIQVITKYNTNNTYLSGIQVGCTRCPQKMFLQERFALLLKERFFGTPCTT